MAAALNVREVGQREPLFNLKSISNNSPGDQNFALSLSTRWNPNWTKRLTIVADVIYANASAALLLAD